MYIPLICGSALIIGPVQSLALSYLSFEQNPHGVTVMSTGFQIAGCIGASLFSGIYAICQPPSYGFTAVCLLSTVFAVAGIGLALYENRLSRTVVVEKPKLAGIGAIMKAEPYSISAQATALDALHCMVEKKTTGLPVVAADGTVKGFVSDGDIIRYMNGKESEASGFASMYPLWHNTGALDDRLSALAKFPVLENWPLRRLSALMWPMICRVCSRFSPTSASKKFQCCSKVNWLALSVVPIYCGSW